MLIFAATTYSTVQETYKNKKYKPEVTKTTLQIVFDICDEGFWQWNVDEDFIYHNKRCSSILGFTDEKATRNRDELVEMIHPDEREKALSLIHRVFEEEGFYEMEHRLTCNAGRQIWIVVRGKAIKGKDGKALYMIGSISDITEQKQSKDTLIKEKEISQATLLSVGEGVISTDVDGFITLANPSAERMVGFSKEEIIGAKLDDVFLIMDSKAKTQPPIYRFETEKESLLNNKAGRIVEEFLLNSEGKAIRISIKMSSVCLSDNDTIGYVIVFSDITESYERQKKLKYLSIHDELTGLYNRRYIDNVLDELDNKSNLPLTIMIIDMNNLKLVNDVFGHGKGDEVILSIAEYLRRLFGEKDSIARIGGDEFCVLMPNTSYEEARRIQDRIHKESYITGPISLSLAAGYCVKSSIEENITDIVRRADANMYHNKLKNKSKVKNMTLYNLTQSNYSNIRHEEDHVERVSNLVASMYSSIGKTDEEVAVLKKVVKYHDIGKIIVPKDILNKQDKLTEEEYKKVMEHSRASYQILTTFQECGGYADAILYHHERMDGKGYPLGISGYQIPLEARIIAIADAYDSMTSDRPYRQAMTKDEAIEELIRYAGTQFDSSLVEIFINEVIL